MAEKRKLSTIIKKKTHDFHPGGEKGKLHREIGVPEGEKIPEKKLETAAHSENPEIKRDAIRAETMKKWHHGGGRAAKMYRQKSVRRA
jgi:hypothetical protein